MWKLERRDLLQLLDQNAYLVEVYRRVGPAEDDRVGPAVAATRAYLLMKPAANRRHLRFCLRRLRAVFGDLRRFPYAIARWAWAAGRAADAVAAGWPVTAQSHYRSARHWAARSRQLNLVPTNVVGEDAFEIAFAFRVREDYLLRKREAHRRYLKKKQDRAQVSTPPPVPPSPADHDPIALEFALARYEQELDGWARQEAARSGVDEAVVRDHLEKGLYEA